MMWPCANKTLSSTPPRRGPPSAPGGLLLRGCPTPLPGRMESVVNRCISSPGKRRLAAARPQRVLNGQTSSFCLLRVLDLPRCWNGSTTTAVRAPRGCSRARGVPLAAAPAYGPPPGAEVMAQRSQVEDDIRASSTSTCRRPTASAGARVLVHRRGPPPRACGVFGPFADGPARRIWGAMALHMIKLCVGCDSVEELLDWHRTERRTGRPWIMSTRMTPKRADHLLDGGSLYRVFKGDDPLPPEDPGRRLHRRGPRLALRGPPSTSPDPVRRRRGGLQGWR